MKQYLTEEQVIQLTHSSRFGLKKFRNRDHDAIPFLKMGRRYLYDPEKIEAWMEREAHRSVIAVCQLCESPLDSVECDAMDELCVSCAQRMRSG